MERKNSSYELQEYYDLIRPLYDNSVQMDIVKNKVGQPSLRIHYELNKLKIFDMFIFENGFAVAYKPNGRTHIYEHLTPKQARKIAKVCIDWWMGL